MSGQFTCDLRRTNGKPWSPKADPALSDQVDLTVRLGGLMGRAAEALVGCWADQMDPAADRLGSESRAVHLAGRAVHLAGRAVHLAGRVVHWADPEAHAVGLGGPAALAVSARQCFLPRSF